MSVPGSVSPLVDSCERLIYKKALKTYNCISPENKRWLGLEDVLQDGIIEAWEAEQRYKLHASLPKPKSGPVEFHSKYSSYLYRGLDMLFSARYWVPLRQQKRVALLLELDKPIETEDGDMGVDLVAQHVPPDRLLQAVSGVTKVCCALSAPVLPFMLDAVISDHCKIRHNRLTVLQDIALACSQFGVERADLELVMCHQESKSQVLEGVLRGTTKSSADDARVLECVSCRGLYSLADARIGRYSATNLTCSGCLQKLYGSGSENSCFGRLKVVDNTRTVTEGYSEADAECRLHCRDRVACKHFIEEARNTMSEPVEDMSVDLEDMDFSDIETADDTEDEDAVTTDDSEGDEEAEDEQEEKPAKATKKAAPAKATKKAAPAKATKKAAPAKATKKAAPAKASAPAKSAKKAAVTKATKPESVAEPEKVAPAKATKKAAVRSIDEAVPRRTRTAKSGERIDPKTAKAQGLIKLDDKGRDMPFKASSMMRWILEQCMEPGGATEKALEKEVMKLGYDYKFQRAVLLSGKSGDSSLRPYPTTHVWDTEVEGGRIRVFDMKRVAYYAKMSRIGKVGK